MWLAEVPPVMLAILYDRSDWCPSWDVREQPIQFPAMKKQRNTDSLSVSEKERIYLIGGLDVLQLWPFNIDDSVGGRAQETVIIGNVLSLLLKAAFAWLNLIGGIFLYCANVVTGFGVFDITANNNSFMAIMLVNSLPPKQPEFANASLENSMSKCACSNATFIVIVEGKLLLHHSLQNYDPLRYARA